MQLFDTHLHLDDEQFADQHADVVARAEQAGVTAMIAVATTAASSHQCVDLAARFPVVFASVGIQPNYCGEVDPGDWEQVAALADQPSVVALGETGLDRYWDYAPFDVQQDYFRRHLELGRQKDLPVIIHMRDCGDDVVKMLVEVGGGEPILGVMHSFTGDRALAERCLELGLFISFAGMVTYKKSEDLRQVAAIVPDDRILVETDAPYLSPHPMRKQRPNEPALVLHTVQCLAEVRGTTLEAFATQTTDNAHRLFRRAARRPTG